MKLNNILLPFLLLPAMASAEIVTQVAIIGGGVAGLHTAMQLELGGMSDWKIFEARNRLGGRVHSVEFDGKPVEMGANWIQGINKNPFVSFDRDGLVWCVRKCRRRHRSHTLLFLRNFLSTRLAKSTACGATTSTTTWEPFSTPTDRRSESQIFRGILLRTHGRVFKIVATNSINSTSHRGQC